ncbi:MAG: methyltransferase domain-containing protein [candidate division KSB1 bacterium]|nr:methyltransferase domain-containing protein [candidate division KSB1 bacterium]
MTSRQIADFVGKRLWMRRLLYIFIRITTLREWYLHRAVNQVFRRYPQPVHVLDAGSGMGQHSFHIARKTRGHVVGIEADSSQVDDCRDAAEKLKLSVHFRTGDIRSLDIERKFHLILCSSVLEHLNDDSSALNEFSRLLLPGGTLIVYVPVSEQRVLSFLDRKIQGQLRQVKSKYPHGHVRYYNAPELRGKLENAGFRVHETEKTYGPYGRLAYDIVTSVQYNSLFLWVFPIYFLLVHPFVMLLMWADLKHDKVSGNGLLMMAVKHA